MYKYSFTQEGGFEVHPERRPPSRKRIFHLSTSFLVSTMTPENGNDEPASELLQTTKESNDN